MVKLPAGKVLIPGVLESKANFIEHPELVAQRIVRFASLVGRENVIASSDCGFAQGAGGRGGAALPARRQFLLSAQDLAVEVEILEQYFGRIHPRLQGQHRV